MFPITERGMTVVNFLDDTECYNLLDVGASKSLMSRRYYLRIKYLDNLSMFSSKIKNIQVVDGQYCNGLFIVLVVVKMHSHRFERYIILSEIHDNAELGIRLKYV